MTFKEQTKEFFEDLSWRVRDRRFLTSFPSKLPVYFLKLPYSTDNLYIDLYSRAGIALETEETNGYGHLLEHYLSEILYQKYGHDLDSNGRINYEEMSLYVKTDYRHFLEDSESFLSTVLNPVFDNDKILTYEKRAIVNEINNSRHQLDQKIIDEGRSHRFKEEGCYSRSFSDQIKNTRSVTLAQIADYYHKIINRSNSFLLVSGSVLPPSFRRKIFELVNKYPLQEGERLDYPKVTYDGRKIVPYPDHLVSGTYLSISFPSYSFSDKESNFLSISLLSKLLTGRSQYGIGREAREHGFYGLTYRLSRFHNSGFLSFNTYVPTEEIDIFLELLASKIRFLKEGLIEKNDLTKYVKMSLGQDKNCWRSNGCRMDWVSSDLLHYGKVESLNSLKRSYDELTPGKIQEVAQEIFTPENAQLILYGEIPENLDKLWNNFSI